MQLSFLVDVNVGRLAKWLRAMGYDTLFVPDADDGDLVRLAEGEGRVLLTRDRLLLERRAIALGRVQAVLVQGDDFRAQLSHVAGVFCLPLRVAFTRCLECNATLVDLSREDAAGRVPPYVYQTQADFKECPGCRRVYWRGTHWRNMHLELARVEGA